MQYLTLCKPRNFTALLSDQTPRLYRTVPSRTIHSAGLGAIVHHSLSLLWDNKSAAWAGGHPDEGSCRQSRALKKQVADSAGSTPPPLLGVPQRWRHTLSCSRTAGNSLACQAPGKPHRLVLHDRAAAAGGVVFLGCSWRGGLNRAVQLLFLQAKQSWSSFLPSAMLLWCAVQNGESCMPAYCGPV